MLNTEHCVTCKIYNNFCAWFAHEVNASSQEHDAIIFARDILKHGAKVNETEGKIIIFNGCQRNNTGNHSEHEILLHDFQE